MNLQHISLDSIASNFERYLPNQDLYMKQDLEYLQRKFSAELLIKLSAKDKLKEEYVDILINKYLKTLDTRWFAKCSWDKVTSKIAEIGYNIEELFINESSSDGTPTKPWHDVICYLPNLRKFTFYKYCYDALLENIAKFCANIEEISTGFHDRLTDIKYICRDENGRALCKKLKYLFIENIQDEDLKYLVSNLPSLNAVSDKYKLPRILYSLHKDDLSTLDKVQPYNFISLSIEPELEFDENYFKIFLSLCPNLKKLSCRLHCENHSDYLASYLPEIEDLFLYSNRIYVSNYNVNNVLISKGGKLLYLHLWSCSVSATVLSKSCPRLKALILHDAQFIFEEGPTIEFYSLTEVRFTLHRDGKDRNGVQKLLLSLSKQLKLLEFSFSDLSSSELQSCLLRCCEQNPIESLLISGCRIEMEILKQVLLCCHSLKCLNVIDSFQESELGDLLRYSETLPTKPEVITERLRLF